MSSSHVAVLDFGSSKITVLIGNFGVVNNLRVVAKGVSDYAGFMDGEFLEPENLTSAISEALQNAKLMFKKKIKKLYVGVPAEFTYNSCVNLEINFNGLTKIKNFHINKLFALNKNKVESNTHTIINRVPLYYKLSDGSKVVNPNSQCSQSLQAYTSFILADNNFINLVERAINNFGIKHVEFVSNTLAEALYLIEPQDREVGGVIVDCGYITTSVGYFYGNGLKDLRSFSLGGGHITSDLSELLKISFNTAEELKRKLVISLNAKPNDYYEAFNGQKSAKFSAKTVNDIALARIDMIADTIKKCLQEFYKKQAENYKVYLTGGGICYIKGIKDYLKNYLNCEIEIINPQPLQFNKPDLSSEISLLAVAINMEK